MVITVWDPPWRCEVAAHRDAWCGGPGVFEVLALPGDRVAARLVRAARSCRSAGSGRLGFPVVAPAVSGRASRASLEKLARAVEAEHAEATGRRVDDLVVGADGLARCGWGASTPDYVGLPRRGVGSARPRRRPALRAADPRGVPVRAVLADDPAQAGRRSGRRSPASRSPPWRRSTTATRARLMDDAGIVRNRAKVGGDADERAGRSRPARGRRRGRARPADLVVRARPRRARRPAPDVRPARADRRVEGAGEGA